MSSINIKLQPLLRKTARQNFDIKRIIGKTQANNHFVNKNETVVVKELLNENTILS